MEEEISGQDYDESDFSVSENQFLQDLACQFIKPWEIDQSERIAIKRALYGRPKRYLIRNAAEEEAKNRHTKKKGEGITENVEDHSKKIQQRSINFEQFSNTYRTREREDRSRHQNSNSKSKINNPFLQSQSIIDKDVYSKQKKVLVKGIEVAFPYPPYQIQVKYMGKVIECLDKKVNGILESPTGTGKSLCLLASIFSWIEKQREKKLEAPRVIYLSRTHSQLTNLLKQLGKTCFRPTMSTVGSREFLCIKQSLSKLKGREKVEACSKSVKITKHLRQIPPPEPQKIAEWQQMKAASCSYYRQKDEVISIARSRYFNKIIDLEEMKEMGKRQHLCPYYYPFFIEDKCDFLCMPYNYLLDEDLLSKFKDMIKGSILVFDEAHNLTDASCSGRSYQLWSANIKGAEAQLKKVTFGKGSGDMISFRRQQNSNLHNLEKKIADLDESIKKFFSRINFDIAPYEKEKMYLIDETYVKYFSKNQMVRALFQMLSINRKGQKEIKAKGQEEETENVEISLQVLKGFLAELKELAQQISHIVEGLMEIHDAIFHNMQKIATFCTKVINLLRPKFGADNDFLTNQSNHYRLAIKIKKEDFELMVNRVRIVDKKNKDPEYSLQLVCLVPWLTFDQISSYNPQSILLTSGTLSPLETWEKELKLDLPIKFRNQHIIKRDQIKLFIIKNALGGSSLNFSYENTNKGGSRLWWDLVETIYSICERVPHGVLVVCPSFRILYQIRMLIDKHPIFGGRKPIIIEQQSNQQYIKRFKENASTKKGAILLCVCRGRASEGVDFPDELCRAVIFVGVPYPNVKDPILLEKKDHFMELSKRYPNLSFVKYSQLYMNSTIRSINQALGRVIRHSQDFGMLFLLDPRYCQRRLKQGLPEWAATQLQIWESCNDILLEKIKEFYISSYRRFERGETNLQSQEKSNYDSLKSGESKGRTMDLLKKGLFDDQDWRNVQKEEINIKKQKSLTEKSNVFQLLRKGAIAISQKTIPIKNESLNFKKGGSKQFVISQTVTFKKSNRNQIDNQQKDIQSEQEQENSSRSNPQ